MQQLDVPNVESGPRVIARRVYTTGIWLLLASIIIQFFLAGLGVLASWGFFWWHVNVNGAVVGLLPLLLLAVGWYGRVPRNTLLLTAAVFGLVVLQSVLLIPYRSGATGLLRAVSGLHVVNALAIFWVGLRLLERAEALRRATL
ncbi:MAG: DUF6220 domain-containing protein [Candidatus Dormibacteraeota bacterium]|nr:DUF6220 domain-containing protein [Candidatus Dormibacteraeota bacterium]